MKEYKIFETRSSMYKAYILCLSYNSVLHYLENLKNENIIRNLKGRLLIDQLLVTGSSNNKEG